MVTAKLGEVGLVTELPGRLEASRIAQVRARAAGIVQKRLFKEGSKVKAGQPLFTIDAAPYQAALLSAKAALTRSEANAAQAASLAKRYRPLVKANAISKQEYANAVAGQKTTEADVAVARAAVQTAQINVGYGSVTSPISGRIGRALVTEGALVGQGEATPLAVVQQIDPLYVNFTQSSGEALRLRRAFADGKMTRANDGNAAQVQVVLEDGRNYPLPGKLLFSDLTVDQSTGQITLRAEVPNPKGFLLPGMYVRVRIELVTDVPGLRELHDVVAHGMSVVVVQATTASYRHPGLSEELKREFDDIAANSRRAMTEMRSMLGSLRNSEAGRELGPQPGLSDLPQLYASARSAGVQIAEPEASDVEGHDIGEVIALTAYRIVQEALSNVIRHAPGATAQVDFAIRGGQLAISVVNSSSAVGAVMAQLDRGQHLGQGLIGMRERAAIVGGSVVCVPLADGGFSVTASLPLGAVNKTSNGTVGS